MAELTQLGASHNFASGDLNCDGQIAIVDAWQKFWFADGRPYDATKADSGYHKLDMVNTRIGANTDPSWSAGDLLVQDTTGAKAVFDEIIDNGDGTYEILAYRVTSTQFGTLNNIQVSGKNTLTAANITDVNNPPYWLNWTLSTGDFPDGGSNAMGLFLGRIYMNNMYAPNQWYATRQGDALDMDTSQTDEQAAVSSQSSDIGRVGDEIIGFIPYKDYFMVFGCASQLWVLIGDPASGGHITNLSYSVGLFSPSSWTIDNKGNIYIIDLYGFYRIPVSIITEGGKVENLMDKIDAGLFSSLQFNRRTDRISCEFDKDRNGVLVTAVMKDGTWSCSWFYHIDTGAFCPEEYPTVAVPASMCFLDNYRGDRRGLLLGGQDGYIRKFDESTKSDNNGDTTSAIDAKFLIGPINLTEVVRGKGRIRDLIINLSEDTDGCDWALYAADSAEALVDGIDNETLTAIDSGTFSSGGGQNAIRTKVSGAWLGIVLSNDTADESFGFENLEIEFTEAGRRK